MIYDIDKINVTLYVWTLYVRPVQTAGGGRKEVLCTRWTGQTWLIDMETYTVTHRTICHKNIFQSVSTSYTGSYRTTTAASTRS